jgi:hypothetical protein
MLIPYAKTRAGFKWSFKGRKKKSKIGEFIKHLGADALAYRI